MSLLLETRAALGDDDTLSLCQSRSLLLTRYARPELSHKTQPTRQAFLNRVIQATHTTPNDQRPEAGLRSWQAWVATVATPQHVLYAKLEARLLINMGGTVLENAGLQLDRFGTAYLPGSAVKACARRTAIAALRQWCETGTKPDAAANDALAPVCAGFTRPQDLLLTILRVFGCTDLEWGTYEESGNDLAWACEGQWDACRDYARAALTCVPGCDPEESKPTRRGAIAFLPAYPYRRPRTDLELDVLTSHHQKYYSGALTVATDTEDPIPVYFPAVAADTVYTFAVLPVGHPKQALLETALTWLKIGLETLGLGAKTAAGYGSFSDVTADIAASVAKAAEVKRRADEEAAQKAREAEALAARKARDAARATMTPDERADAELAERAADWGWMKPQLAKFKDHDDATKSAILRWFNGAGRDRWLNEIKPGAQAGKKPWSQIIGEIHAAKKKLKLDLP